MVIHLPSLVDRIRARNFTGEAYCTFCLSAQKAKRKPLGPKRCEGCERATARIIEIRAWMKANGLLCVLALLLTGCQHQHVVDLHLKTLVIEASVSYSTAPKETISEAAGCVAPAAVPAFERVQ